MFLFNQRQNIKIRENKTRIKIFFDSLMIFCLFVCFFFGLIFVIKDVPGIHPVKRLFGGPEGVPGVFQMCSGGVVGCSGPVPGFTDTLDFLG